MELGSARFIEVGVTATVCVGSGVDIETCVFAVAAVGNGVCVFRGAQAARSVIQTRSKQRYLCMAVNSKIKNSQQPFLFYLLISLARSQFQKLHLMRELVIDQSR